MAEDISAKHTVIGSYCLAIPTTPGIQDVKITRSERSYFSCFALYES